MRVTTAFKRLLRLPGVRGRCLLHRRGGDRDRPSASAPAGVRAVRADRPPAGDPRPARQALAASGPGRDSVLIECELRRLRCRDCGVRLEPVPWARPGARAHARLRGHRGVAGAADGVRADHAAAAGRVAHDRPDRRSASSPTTSTSAASQGLVMHRRRRDLLSPPSPLPDHGRRPRHAARSCGARRAATAPPCRASSTSSATARTRSGPSRST